MPHGVALAVPRPNRSVPRRRTEPRARASPDDGPGRRAPTSRSPGTSSRWACIGLTHCRSRRARVVRSHVAHAVPERYGPFCAIRGFAARGVGEAAPGRRPFRPGRRANGCSGRSPCGRWIPRGVFNRTSNRRCAELRLPFLTTRRTRVDRSCIDRLERRSLPATLAVRSSPTANRGRPVTAATRPRSALLRGLETPRSAPAATAGVALAPGSIPLPPGVTDECRFTARSSPNVGVTIVAVTVLTPLIRVLLRLQETLQRVSNPRIDGQEIQVTGQAVLRPFAGHGASE
jgi:hypothetical protein